ncbi:META domain-containing protein [Fusobacterium sp.]|uniref:META domain-containing protein n=1 Tax=Fusobacterium sp. TaxID=68766 RepID=UPI00396C7360
MKKTIFLLGMTLFMFGCAGFGHNLKNAGVEDISQIYSKEYVLENSDITINFEKDRVYGFSGVNRYFGSFTADKDQIKIGNLASTLMLGNEQDMERESQYLKKLSQVNKITIDGKTVILTDGQIILKFENVTQK